MSKVPGRLSATVLSLAVLTLGGGASLAHDGGQIVQSRTGAGYSDGHKVLHPTDPVSGSIEWTFSWQKSGKVNGIFLKIFKEGPLPPLATDTDDGTCSGEIVAGTTAPEGKSLARQNSRTLTTQTGSAQYCAQLTITGSGTVTASVVHSP